METHKERVIALKVDYLYKKMTSTKLQNLTITHRKFAVRKYYQKWLLAKHQKIITKSFEIKRQDYTPHSINQLKLF